MPTLYQIALMIMRTFAGINLVGGITGLIAIVPVAMVASLLGGDAKSLVEPLLVYLLEWGFTATIIGLSLLVLAKPVARFAAKQ